MGQNNAWGRSQNPWDSAQAPLSNQCLHNFEQLSQQATTLKALTPAESNFQQLLLLNALNGGQTLCISTLQPLQVQQPQTTFVIFANLQQQMVSAQKYFSAPIVQSLEVSARPASSVSAFPVWHGSQSQQKFAHQPANFPTQIHPAQVQQSGQQLQSGYTINTGPVSFQFNQQAALQPLQFNFPQVHPTISLVSAPRQNPDLPHINALSGAALSTTHSALLKDLPLAPAPPASSTDWTACRGQEEFSKGASFFKFLEELEAEGVLQRIFRSKDDPLDGGGSGPAAGVIGWRVFEDRDAIWKDRWKRWYMAGKEGKEFKPNSFHQLLRRLGFFPTKLTSKGSHGYDFENSLVFLWNSKSKYKDRKTQKRGSPRGGGTPPRGSGGATRVGSGGDGGEETRSAAGSSSAGEGPGGSGVGIGASGSASDINTPGRTSSSSSTPALV